MENILLIAPNPTIDFAAFSTGGFLGSSGSGELSLAIAGKAIYLVTPSIGCEWYPDGDT